MFNLRYLFFLYSQIKTWLTFFFPGKGHVVKSHGLSQPVRSAIVLGWQPWAESEQVWLCSNENKLKTKQKILSMDCPNPSTNPNSSLYFGRLLVSIVYVLRSVLNHNKLLLKTNLERNVAHS